jgi:hypothetical protein
MKTIRVACPAGSGLNFALNLLRPSFNHKVEFLAVGHERKDILEESPTLVILRDPHDAIASGAERFLRSSEHRYFSHGIDLIEDDNILSVVDQIINEKARYYHFFDDIESLDHVNIFTFDTLTKNPDLFLEQVAKKFDIQENIVKVPEEEVFKAVIEEGNANRVPRSASPGRIKINRYLHALYPGNEFESYKMYLSLKEKVDKGLI